MDHYLIFNLLVSTIMTSLNVVLIVQLLFNMVGYFVTVLMLSI